MTSNKKISFLIPLLFAGFISSSQATFSFGADLTVLHNFKEEQRFWSGGYDLIGVFHFTPKNGIYISSSFFANGKFVNKVQAVANSSTTIPQQIPYVNHSKLKFKEISIGWRKYLKGAPNIEKGWSLYSNAGFGLFMGTVENTLSVSPDTSLYHVPVIGGKGKFKRLTIDLGLGYEMPLSGDLYLFSELEFWIPTSDYPSRYIYKNADAPLAGMVSAGIRIQF